MVQVFRDELMKEREAREQETRALKLEISKLKDITYVTNHRSILEDNT